ncbi:alpha/beta fold hydrolase [Aeromicrobium choanae]|uniref:Pimeloyl-ACP methyl ester carboxylesterase n=1 Tax=Aeromicrobium choanae TaxID=1736691 RepID=A0A1T4YUB6_9ACTN|nr:alpha/beta hydrolase [Aeromicrobium choanae]SKB05188.1 Pimeloyl-ACP methyl ester carboxylesterase [Aeromicrobium choanae]
MTSVAGRVAATAGAFAAAGVAGAAATILNKRKTEQRRLQRGEEVAFGTVRGDSSYVSAADDVPIHVEVDDGPAPTIVFVHGWMCDLDTWHFQRLALRDHARLVFMEQRSHGRSGRSGPRNSSLHDMADDLRRVLDEHAAEGPVVIVGHSMGGMAVMQLAQLEPELFDDRVKGVVLISTSAGKLMRGSPGLRFVVPLVKAATPLLDWGREFNSYSIIRRWAFGPHAEPSVVDMADEMILRAPTTVVLNFYDNFVELDLGAGLDAISRCRTSVVCGTKDVMTPFSHSRWLARHIAGAELVPVNDAGHMVMLEEHEQVTEAIERVLKDIA